MFYWRLKCGAWRQKGAGLETQREAWRRRLEVIQRIRRLRMSFCWAHGSPTPPPSLGGYRQNQSKPVKTSQNQSKLLNLKFGEFYEHKFHRVNKVGYSSTFMNIHFIELIKQLQFRIYEHIFHRVNKEGVSSTFMNIYFIELIKQV